uniref:MHC class I antigen n=1 Tax=Knipowitschia caucasica TaxID=637954 RepID=A0AAV2MKP3_KNICA
MCTYSPTYRFAFITHFFQEDVFSRAPSADGWQYTSLSGYIFRGHRRGAETGEQTLLTAIRGWRREQDQNGCHDNSTQLQPVAMGASVPRPPPAGLHHDDEGQLFCA